MRRPGVCPVQVLTISNSEFLEKVSVIDWLRLTPRRSMAGTSKERKLSLSFACARFYLPNWSVHDFIHARSGIFSIQSYPSWTCSCSAGMDNQNHYALIGVSNRPLYADFERGLTPGSVYFSSIEPLKSAI